MATHMETALQPQNWPATTWVLLLTTLGIAFSRVFWRPSLPQNAPKWFKLDDWSVVGVVRFYKDRATWFQEALRHTQTGNFSFYVGKKQIVGVSGAEGRKTFFESRDLNFTAGFAELLTGQPATSQGPGDMTDFFKKNIVALLKRENFVKNLDTMTGDVRAACQTLADAPEVNAGWKVTDPFECLYEMVYQLTMRTLGINDIADDPKLLRDTLAYFEWFEGCTSTANVVFPWLPTPNHIMRLYQGARLAMVFQKIAESRRKTGQRGNDALQFLIDQGCGIRDIAAFHIGSLYAGQLNSGITAGWLQVLLVQNLEWFTRVRAEIDAVISQHRTSKEQVPVDVLDTLDLDNWENEFPLLDLCLREAIRLTLPGTAFRKNTSGHDVPIGKTGEVIPNNAFAAYLTDEGLFNSDWYQDPAKFDPSRYFDNRAEDKKAPHAYMGWGSGRHPCLGMKFAKLEIYLIATYFITLFDFELSDKEGNAYTGPHLAADRNLHSAKKPAKPIYLRYKARA